MLWLVLATASAGSLAVEARARATEVIAQKPGPCADADELSHRVEQALGQPLDTAVGSRFEVSTERVAEGFSARVELSGAAVGPALRTLVAPTCEELMDSVALSIALAIGSSIGERDEPNVTAASNERTGTSSETPLAERAQDERTRDVDSSGERDATGLGIEASASVVADTGSLPKPGLGIGIGLGLDWPAVAVRAEGIFLPTREGQTDPADPASAGGELGLLTGALLGCLPLAVNVRAVALRACLGGELGRLSGHGTRVDTSHDEGTLWAAARIDLGARWTVPATSLGLDFVVTAAAPLLRDEFVVENVGAVHQPASVVGRAGVGVSWSSE